MKNEAKHHGCEDIKLPHSVPRGLLRLLIMHLVKANELTGMEIAQTLEDMSEGMWKPSPGSIYPMLSSLEEEELIETVRQDGRSKVYRLSNEGCKRIKEVFRHKEELMQKTRLTRTLWLQMLEPNDRVHFLIVGMKTTLDHLQKTTDHLPTSNKSKIVKDVVEIIDNLKRFQKSLERGDTNDDQ